MLVISDTSLFFQFFASSPNLKQAENELILSALLNVSSFLLVVETFFFDHSQMPFPSLSLASVMVSHSSGHFLIIHLLRSVGLHASPRLGKLQGVCDLEY